MPDWLSDASANRHIKTYVKDFLDLSGNLTVRSNEEYKWNAYGQILSGRYESDGVYFGVSTDIDASGTTIVVGASADDTQASNAGAVYVYRYDTTAKIWYQLGNTITESTGSNTGRLVKITDNGNRIAYADDIDNEGYIYDYNSSTNTWDSAGYIQVTPDVIMEGGFELSGDGNTIFFGDHVDGTYGANTGTLCVYRNTSGTTWTQIGKLSSDNLGLVNSHTWGLGISYNGNRLLVGAPYYDDADGNVDSGLFWVLDYTGDGTASTDNSDWSQVGSTIYGSPSERLGVAGDMSSDGSIIVVGSNNITPSAYVYQYDATVSGSWKLLGTPISVLNTPHGACLSNDGTILLVNDRLDDTAGTDSGALYIYKYIDNDWVQQGSTIYGSYTSSAWGQDYGTGIAINADGTKVVAGGLTAYVNTGNSGYVQALEWSAKSYGPLIDISGETIIFGKDMHKDDPNYYKVVQDGMDASVYFVNNELYGRDATDYFGASLAMNEDGTIMIVGSPLADVETSRVGVGIVYRWQNERWGQMGQNISPTTDYESFSAASVDMNDAGDKVVIGSQENLTGGASGLLTSYEFINGDWVQRGSALTSSNSSGRFGGEGCAMDGTGNIIAGMDVVGSVKVYQYVEGNGDWSQLGSDISVTSGRANSAFHLTSDAKRRISLNQDGTIIAVGDVFDSTTGTSDGRLSVYKFTGNVTDGSWNLIGNHITVPPTTLSENLGREVSINNDGTIVAATALFYNNNEGRTFIFKYSEEGGVWAQLGTDIGADRLPDSDLNYNANSVSLSGDGKTVAIGHGYADTAGQNTGAINVLKYANGDWVWVGALYGSQIDGYLKYACISGDGTRIAGGTPSGDSTGADAGMVITASIINNLDGAAMKIEHDRVHIPKLEAGNSWTTATSIFEGILSMPMMTLTGLSSYERDFRKEWGLDANTEGFNRDRWAFTHDTGHKHASYLYVDNNQYPEHDLLFRGFERVDETHDYFYRSGYALVSRYLGDAMFFQTSSTEENQSLPNKRFSLGIGQPPGWYALNVVGNAYVSGVWDGSDDRLKHNEELITNGLETIRKLAPRHYFKTRKMYDVDHNFDLDASGNPLDASGNTLPATEYSIETGFIAQEVKEISELAHTFKKGQEDQPHGIQYSSIFVRAIKALQELDEKVQQRQAIITSLEEKIQTLENA